MRAQHFHFLLGNPSPAVTIHPMKSSRQPFFLLAGAALSIAVLLSGCGKYKERQEAAKRRAEEKAKAEAAKKVVKEESDKIFKESSEKKDVRRDQGPGSGSVSFGDQTLAFSEATIHLPSAGSTDAASLKCSSTNGVSLVVATLTLENSPDKPAKIAGQTFDLNDSNNTGAEITTEDGSKWQIKGATLIFNRADRSLVILSIEGNAVDATGAKPDKMKINGEIQARVKGANGNFINEPTPPPAP